MTKYFLKDTPLAGLERQMMTPPHFTHQGGGQAILCQFRYRTEDVICRHCRSYQRGGCAEQVCPWLTERAEAGAVTYPSLAGSFFRAWKDSALGVRLSELLAGKQSVAYYEPLHAIRLKAYDAYLAHHQRDGSGNRRLAGMFLLTATDALRRCAIPRTFALWNIDIGSWKQMRTLSEQEYVLFQAAKGIWLGQRTISVPELCDRELVENKTLGLILDAELIAHYGKAMLILGGTGGGIQ